MVLTMTMILMMKIWFTIVSPESVSVETITAPPTLWEVSSLYRDRTGSDCEERQDDWRPATGSLDHLSLIPANLALCQDPDKLRWLDPAPGDASHSPRHTLSCLHNTGIKHVTCSPQHLPTFPCQVKSSRRCKKQNIELVSSDCIIIIESTNIPGKYMRGARRAGRWLGLGYSYRREAPACNWHGHHTPRIQITLRPLKWGSHSPWPRPEQVDNIHTFGDCFYLTILTRRGSAGDNLRSWCQQQISGFREDDPVLLIG